MELMTKKENDETMPECPKCGANRGAGCHTIGAVTRKMRGYHKERRAAALQMLFE